MKRKIKILAYADSPECFSGFGQVSRNILGLLHDSGEYEVTCFGINHNIVTDDFGRIEEFKTPYEILPASFLTNEEMNKGFEYDMLGKKKLMKLLYKEDFDIIWSVQDPYVVGFLDEVFTSLRKQFLKKFQTIFYFPVDCAGISKEWAQIPNIFDQQVVYTDFGKEEVIKTYDDVNDKVRIQKELKVIPHGTNVEDFKPLDKDIKLKIRESLGISKDTCVVINVNRNQPRKDISRTMEAFAKFKKKVPNSILFLYCKPDDIGGNLPLKMKYYGLEDKKDVFFPQMPTGKKAFQGTPIEEVNQAYNSADMCISTTLGEGWGLSLTEAMAAKIPAIFPANSSINEIIGDDERGFKIKCGNHPSLHIQLSGNVDDPIRQLTDVDDMVEKMVFVWENRNKPVVKDKVEAAYKYVHEHTWEKIFKKYWKPLFDKAVLKLNS